MPTIGDIDGDGDVDICIGTGDGHIHWFENTAGMGNPCNFAPIHINPFHITNTSSVITTTSSVASPQIFDLDGDGKQDLLIGMANGNIAWYQNTGNLTFSLITNFLGNVDVKSNGNLFSNDGFASPFFYREGNSLLALVGSVTGQIYQYQVSSPTSPFTLLSDNVNIIYEGAQSTVWYEDINNDGKRDLFTGNASGGLAFYNSASPFVGLAEENSVKEFSFYPNPSTGEIHFELSQSMDGFSASLFSLQGQRLADFEFKGRSGIADISGFEPGLYLVHLRYVSQNVSKNVVKKLIVKN